jgi:hypothetical protein
MRNTEKKSVQSTKEIENKYDRHHQNSGEICEQKAVT